MGLRTKRGRIREDVHYVHQRQQLLCPIHLVGVFGFFTASLPVTLADDADTVFRSGAAGYATLSAVLAPGSLLGALLSARRPGTRLRELVVLGLALSALAVLASAITSKHGSPSHSFHWARPLRGS